MFLNNKGDAGTHSPRPYRPGLCHGDKSTLIQERSCVPFRDPACHSSYRFVPAFDGGGSPAILCPQIDPRVNAIRREQHRRLASRTVDVPAAFNRDPRFVWVGWWSGPARIENRNPSSIAA